MNNSGTKDKSTNNEQINHFLLKKRTIFIVKSTIFIVLRKL